MTDSPKANYTGKYLDDSFKFSRFIRVLRKRWIVIAAVSASVFAANAFYTFTRSPLYRSNTSLLISSSTIAVSDIQIPGINPDGPKVNLGTEIGILKSRPLVVLRLPYQIFKFQELTQMDQKLIWVQKLVFSRADL